MFFRKPIIIGNWKMNKNLDQALSLVKEIVTKDLDESVEKVICVPYLYVNEIRKILEKSDIEIGVQNMYFEKKGAFTGEISPTMLKSCGVKYVILGHSERRNIFKETDDLINKKVISTLENDLIPILCCGETLNERKENKEKEVIENQIKKALLEVDREKISKIIIAYEPIWAIGTGVVASLEDAENMCKYIRSILFKLYKDQANKVRIQYGGSVKQENIKDLMKQENIDGALVGGASLDVSFSNIINYKL